MGTPRIRRLDFRAEQTWCAVASKNVTGTAIDSLIVLKADRCVCVCVKAPFCELTGLETWGLWKGHCLLLGLTPHSAALLALAELGSWSRGHLACKPQSIYYLALYRRSFPTPEAGQWNRVQKWTRKHVGKGKALQPATGCLCGKK